VKPARHFVLPIPATIKQSEELADALFCEIVGQHGSFEARRIFSRLARSLTKRDRQLEAKAMLLWKYLNMPKRNIRQLAIRLAKGADHRALEKRIERAVKDKKVRAYLQNDLFEILGNDAPTF
jgi:hypothetical protein